jgi:hypothetical protein
VGGVTVDDSMEYLLGDAIAPPSFYMFYPQKLTPKKRNSKRQIHQQKSNSKQGIILSVQILSSHFSTTPELCSRSYIFNLILKRCYSEYVNLFVGKTVSADHLRTPFQEMWRKSSFYKGRQWWSECVQ